MLLLILAFTANFSYIHVVFGSGICVRKVRPIHKSSLPRLTPCEVFHDFAANWLCFDCKVFAPCCQSLYDFCYFMGTFRQMRVGSWNAPVQGLPAQVRRVRRLGRGFLLRTNFGISSFWNYNPLLLVLFSSPFSELIILFKLVIAFLILFHIGSPFY